MTITTMPKESLVQLKDRDMGYSEWFTIGQDQIDQFADVTLDHQFIHVDPEAAAKTPFGSTIAHGFLTLSMLAHLRPQEWIEPENLAMAINYGFDKVRFLNPVKVNSQVRGHVTILDVTEKKPGQLLMRQGITVEIMGEEKKALAAQWLGLYICQ
ncbi:MAG: MaoC family dehydratase [Endozoicomonas sp.]